VTVSFCTNCGEPSALGVDVRFCGRCGNPVGGAIDTARLAGWWSRVGAYLVDGLITTGLNLPTLVYAAHVALDGGVHFHNNAGGRPHVTYTHQMVVAFLIVVAGFILTTLLYAPLLLRRNGEHNGQTWGKQVAHIRVTRDDGEPMNLRRALLREAVAKGLIVGAISRVPIVGSIGQIVWYLWPLWDSTNRAPQDMIARTHVFRTGR
jgi:uncharacterized RDD family membrane protein YckC